MLPSPDPPAAVTVYVVPVPMTAVIERRLTAAGGDRREVGGVDAA